MAEYNAEKYIWKPIQSILDQSFIDFELIIVNDGSTDNTKEKIKAFKDERIKYFENDGNYKLIFTRNKFIN
jgi:glycosyltransferase involved in cell wall biosynthesis